MFSLKDQRKFPVSSNHQPEDQSRSFHSFAEFYPYYLSQHQNRVCKILHFIGTLLVLLSLVLILWTGAYFYLWILPVLGYSFAWAGHFFFEKNRPATFSFFLYSLLGDFVMFKDILLGRIKV